MKSTAALLILISTTAFAEIDITKPRRIQATRVSDMPTIDGKIDDACWEQAPVIKDFAALNSTIFAAYKTEAHICYDDARLYIAIKALMPPGVKPAIEPGSKPNKGHDNYMFSDDIFEIMLDPGRSLMDYYQIAVGAYGSTFDCFRRYGGAQLDRGWNGDWDSATHVADGYWSMELAVPFHNLGITADTKAVWGINLCRTTWKPKGEQSSIAANGSFNNPQDFAIVEGLDVDFSKAQFHVSSGVTVLDAAAGRAQFTTPVRNMSDGPRKIGIETWTGDKSTSQVVTLASGKANIAATEWLEIEPLVAGRTDAYIVTSAPKTTKIVVSDADSGKTLAITNTQRPWFLEAARVEMEDPWHKNMSANKTDVVRCTVTTKLATPTSDLVVEIMDGDKVLAMTTITNPTATVDAAVSVGDVPWGAYRMRATFQDASGKALLSAAATATILPGGKHHIKVLNNLVSELMNTAERGLTGESKVAFMNPRDGWVFITTSGNATLNDEKTAITGETMCYLPAGRHNLRVDKPVIVRAVPELIYSCHACGIEWEYLRKHVLPHCNAILGNEHDEAAIREWTGEGKHWYGFSAAPGHGVGGEVFLDAQKYYSDRLSRDAGFRHPLFSGVMVDQISACSAPQKIEIAKMLAWIQQNSALQGKQYRPWFEGAVFGSGADMAFMKLVLDAGWPFAFYVYVPEKDTEAQVRDVIRSSFTKNVIGCNETVHNSVKRCIAQPGYMTYIPEGHSLNVSPGNNYKTLMQMQFETFANDPAFFGLYGSIWYYSPYVNEENLRFGAALFRHYGIEGNTGPLTTDPYVLTHIQNPDFADGTNGWTIKQAQPGSVATKSHTGYGGLQGRFISGSRGDRFITMTRNAKAPNTVSQTLRGLTPGRLYSLKIITADYHNIKEEKSVNEAIALSINITDVEMSQAEGHHQNKSYPNHYGSKLGKFDRDYSAYMTFHWRVFKARGETATLTISDWAAQTEPGGPVGQEIMMNFVEIEPYYPEGI